MVRTLLRVATLSQVLRVTPLDSGTQVATVMQGGHNWGLWEFDREAVGEIGDQSKLWPNRSAPVKDLHGERLKWMGGIADEQQRHAVLLDAFGKGDFLDPPVLVNYPAQSWDFQIRDGAHRIHAAYEHMASAPSRRLRVYWNRLAWP